MTQRIGTVAKKKLSDSVLYFKEKCPCGTEIEFESSTGMVFDKMMARWDKKHAAHVEQERRAGEALEWHDTGSAVSETMKGADPGAIVSVDPVTGVKAPTTKEWKTMVEN